MRILVNRDGQQLGPYSIDEVRAAVAAGTLQPTDLGWVEGTPSWVPLSSILAAAPAVGGVFQPYAFPQAGPQTCGLATTSLILGILSYVLCCVCVLFSIPAIICGHIARAQIRRSQGRLAGEGIALAGLICGYLNVALAITVLVSQPEAVSNFTGAAKVIPEDIRAVNDARQIVVACESYAASHDGKFPNTLKELVPDLLSDSVLSLPNSHGSGRRFDYLVAGRSNLPPDTVVLVGSEANPKGERVVARASGAAAMEHYPALKKPN